MGDCVGEKFLKNNIELPSSEFDDNFIQSGKFVYEVIRVEKGVPLFLEDYLRRLEKTIKLSGIKVDFSKKQIFEDIIQIIRTNKGLGGPIKLMLSKDISVLHYMKPYLPDPIEYITGVNTITIHQERINPNAKIWNPAFRLKIIEALQKAGAYEAILVNTNDEITEGSRSNLFFVKGNELFTSPISAVLPGITRMKVLSACNLVGFKVNEVRLPFYEIGTFDSAFLTGTSRKILLVKQIDNMPYKADNEIVKMISARFEELTSDYIHQWKMKNNL